MAAKMKQLSKYIIFVLMQMMMKFHLNRKKYRYNSLMWYMNNKIAISRYIDHVINLSFLAGITYVIAGIRDCISATSETAGMGS